MAMKKILSLICVFIMLVNIAGCSYPAEVASDAEPALIEPPAQEEIVPEEPALAPEQQDAALALYTPTPADVTNPRAEQLIVHNGNDVLNSGGQVVQVGDSFYFFGSYDNPENDWMGNAIYVRREGSPERYMLWEANRTGSLYYIDGHIVATTGWMQTIRINTQTGEVDETFIEGEIEYVDYQHREIFFWRSTFNDHVQGTEGLHAVNFDGAGERLIAPSGYMFLGIDGDTIYLQDVRRDDDNYDNILYAVNRDGSDLRRLVSFPLTQLGDWRSEPDWMDAESVQQLEVFGDWVFFTLGVHQGTARIFYGGLLRMRTDGSEIEQLFSTGSESFFLVDGWIYFRIFSYGDWPSSGTYRISVEMPKELDFWSAEHIQQADDGRIFYASGRGISGRELRSRSPDGGESVLLFPGSDVPRFEHSDFLRVLNIRVDTEYVFFTIHVSGHAIGDSWRGHDCYMAHYRVRYDGSGLTLINEENLCWVEKD